ncbi:kinase-like domain-containing protein, partial [Paraphysoderma sedebokerense]
VLKSIVAADDEAFKEVQKEIHYMKQFSGHKNIVTYIDSECFPSKFGTNHKAFILMEYCPGGHVVDIMNRRLNDRLTETEILRIFSDTCEAVALFHYSKPPILHRDIKVENVLLSASGSFKLCDYGSATTNIFQPNIVLPSREIYKLEEDIQKHTTLQYRAPELCDLYQRKGMTEKVDIWALGVMLYKLCYYTTPFEEGGQLAILNARYTIPPTPVFSQKLLALIGAMLQDDPRKRPNIYQLLLNVSNMRNVPCPIQNVCDFLFSSHVFFRANK